MHFIVRALSLAWIVAVATAAGSVKNTKADPVEAVVEVFKHLHPAATEAALAVAMNEAKHPSAEGLREDLSRLGSRALGEATASDPNAVRCGVFWFLHIPKTGGDSVKRLLGDMATAKGSKWTFVNLYHNPCDPLLASPNISEWNRSAAWHRAAAELRKPKPRLLVHQHHCSPGLGTYLLPQLKELERELSQRNCSLVLATVLREPVSRVVSSVYFNEVPYSDVRSFVERRSDLQVKYIMFGHPNKWPPSVALGQATPELGGEAAAALSSFQLIGTTENLTSFAARMQNVIGLRNVVGLRHEHSNIPHRFNLTEKDLLWMRWHSMADEWLWNRMLHRYVV